MTPVNYEVETGSIRKKFKTFHINMLRLWVDREESVLSVKTIGPLIQEEEGMAEISPSPTQTESVKDIAINPELSPDQRKEIDSILMEYADIFTDLPGRTNLVEHHIQTTTEIPIHQRPYRLPEAMKAVVRQELDKMLAQGVIEPSLSPWASPVVLVEKKDGSVRFCIDYRKLNAISAFDAYPIPRADEAIERLGDAQYITSLDLTKGYWQVPLGEDAKLKSAFITPFGLFQFKVLPFGMQTAPATFMRLMDQVLKGADKYANAYFDDTSVFSSTWTQHLADMRDVFERVKRANLTIRPSKCFVGFQEVPLLGHVVGNGKVRPQEAKVSAVKDFPIPKTKVRAFLGLVGYYRRFIPKFSSVAAPLSDLTKKNKANQVVWLEECQAAFTKLKQALVEAPVLQNPNFNRPFVLQTDASDRGIGAVLSQDGADGQEHPIAYLSRKLLTREVSYSAVEKECLAIVWGVQKLHTYLYGRSFTIQTDHQPLRWLNQIRDKNQRLLRWSLTLQQYRFVMEHRSGAANGNADGLSRAT